MKGSHYRYSLSLCCFSLCHFAICPGNLSILVMIFLILYFSFRALHGMAASYFPQAFSHTWFIQAVANNLQLQTILQWITLYICVSVLLGAYVQSRFLEVELLCQKIRECLGLLDTARFPSGSSGSACIPSSLYARTWLHSLGNKMYCHAFKFSHDLVGEKSYLVVYFAFA